MNAHPPMATIPEQSGDYPSTSHSPEGRLAARLILLGLLAASAFSAFAEPADPPSRYRIETVTPGKATSMASSCGRFAIEAEARYATEARSADGRYALKAVNAPAVGCDPFPDPLFENGFEDP